MSNNGKHFSVMLDTVLKDGFNGLNQHRHRCKHVIMDHFPTQMLLQPIISALSYIVFTHAQVDI
jgi:hypothetical protein